MVMMDGLSESLCDEWHAVVGKSLFAGAVPVGKAACIPPRLQEQRAAAEKAERGEVG
jgi:hypothetical protein